MRALACVLLLAAGSAHALEITLGLGVCDNDGDYCTQPIGKIEARQALWESETFHLDATVTHFSEPGNGEPRGGDYGVNIFTIDFTWKITD